jgi:hypothetical protein
MLSWFLLVLVYPISLMTPVINDTYQDSMVGVINDIGYTNTEGTRTAWQVSLMT